MRSRFCPTFDPYSYSRGRWLDQNEQRQKARRIEFSFDALLDVAVNCSKSAREVVACEKREGGFNRVFIVELDNGEKVVAKVPMRFAGPPALTTMSEVATLRYVKSKTSVPVPRVLAWSSKAESNHVGIEYIIMEHMSGVALTDVWPHMTELQHIEFIESLGAMVKELCALDFAALGSLYLNTPDKPAPTHPIDEEYCIGPHCGRQFWGFTDDKTTSAAIPQGFQGPWQGMSRLFADLNEISKLTVEQRGSSQKVVKDHLQLLDTNMKTLEAVENTTTVQDSCSSLLFHPDLHARNIFVDPNEPKTILGLIDWQSAAIEPAFSHVLETPDFAEEPLLDKTLDADDAQYSSEAQNHAQRCKKTWAIMTFLCPKLGKATALNPALCRYLAGVVSGCADEATSLRSLLADLSSEWNGLGIPGACPYQPSSVDANLLNVEQDQLESTKRLRMYLSRLLRCETDGWVEEGRWNEVIPVYREQYAEFVSACIASREEDENEEDAKRKADALWPFDLR
ncbi:unnamed protein product [Zymoseptoria tritici ST99CH_3D7]|uniref:Altered inheritance of mitochondria protein 9, mitochondrial n=1 Tax=Zymoseptoria tritici (strain ST99CH_3D7) TaxID=1276538 RepID=A0A1X7RK30_ZYMT9|nr:unnamed protein product [Zymoseptoria tritici ST99CH_3D7]